MNATLINLYHICHRELWLHHHGIRMEHTSDVVYEGRLIGETSYEDRAQKNRQLELEGGKIDFYDAQQKIVYETKKSDKTEAAHVAQVQYYLYLLHQNGVEGARGIIEYPRQRKRTEVTFSPGQDQALVESWIAAIEALLKQEECPPVLKKPICKTCSYFEYCYANEG